MKLFFFLIALSASFISFAQDSANYSKSEIIYGRKDGMALTMIKLLPKENVKGKAIMSLVSGNWISNYNMSQRFMTYAEHFVKSGYTVFLVMHGSQPRYSITDETEDIKRAVRFIRYNAKEYGIDPDHIGITGSSSGGHLSLMTALAEDKMYISARDPIDRVSSRVQAAAVFFPPTDFLNWGRENSGMNRQAITRAGVAGAFDFKKQNDTTRLYERITGEDMIKKIGMNMSPVNNVSNDDPPVFIAHGDADPVVPLQQSEVLIKKLKEAGVPNELYIHPGGGHGWSNSDLEHQKFIAWFDKFLK
ncbi:MAG: alpha/beta hydrolase [Ferruginibacter sp.]